MREILFRGKRIDNSEWVEGYYVRLYGSNGRVSRRIYTSCAEVDCGDYYPDFFEVQPSTVGLYTGLKDKNRRRIFEGDIVKAQDDLIFSPFCDGLVGKVVYTEAAFFIEPKDPTKSEYLFNECAVYEVLGNMHDNPELLEAR